MADSEAGPGSWRLTVFGVLEPGWSAGEPTDSTRALSLLYPEVPLSAAEVKRLEKAKKFREKQQKEKEAKEKDGGAATVSLIASASPRLPSLSLDSLDAPPSHTNHSNDILTRCTFVPSHSSSWLSAEQKGQGETGQSSQTQGCESIPTPSHTARLHRHRLVRAALMSSMH